MTSGIILLFVAVVIILGVIILAPSLGLGYSSGVLISKSNSSTVKLESQTGNMTVAPQQVLNSVGATVNFIDIKTVVEYARCDYFIYPAPLYSLAVPEYYVFPTNYTGPPWSGAVGSPVTSNECSCPASMPRNIIWSSPMFGLLYQPDKVKTPSPYNGTMCDSYWCYSSGMRKIGDVYPGNPQMAPTRDYRADVYLQYGDNSFSGVITQDYPTIKLGNITLGYDVNYNCSIAPGYLTVFNGAVKNGSKAGLLGYPLDQATNNFNYRINHRDEVISAVNDYLTSDVTNCVVVNNSIQCRQTTTDFPLTVYVPAGE